MLAAVDAPYRLLFDVPAETGARLAEVLGLTWQDIDLEGETVTFTHQLDRKARVSRSRPSARDAVSKFTAARASKLRAHKLASGYSGPHDLVFANRIGKGLDHRNVGGRVLARAVTRAGLEAVERGGEVVSSAPTFHSLRHSHASALIANGWDIEEVRAHASGIALSRPRNGSTCMSSMRPADPPSGAIGWRSSIPTSGPMRLIAP